MFDSVKGPRVCLAATLASACIPGSLSLGNDTDTVPASTTGGSTDAATSPGTTGASEPTTAAPGTTAASTGPATSSAGTTADDTTAGLDDTTTGTGGTGASTSGADTSAGTTSTGAEDTSTSGLGTTGADTSSSMGNDTDGPAICCQIPDMPNAAVSGMTPFGPVDLSWAWYGEASGACPDLRFIRLFPNPDPSPNQKVRQIEVGMGEDDWMNGFPGIGPAVFTVFENDSDTFILGEIDVVSYDPAEPPLWCDPGDPVVVTDAQFVVSFVVKDAQKGWDITGEVSAKYCPVFNEICV